MTLTVGDIFGAGFLLLSVFWQVLSWRYTSAEGPLQEKRIAAQVRGPDLTSFPSPSPYLSPSPFSLSLLPLPSPPSPLAPSQSAERCEGTNQSFPSFVTNQSVPSRSYIDALSHFTLRRPAPSLLPSLPLPSSLSPASQGLTRGDMNQKKKHEPE